MHLTEFQCQQAAGQPWHRLPEAWQSHLVTCETCRRSVAQYRRLYTVLGDIREEVPPFSPQFARNCSATVVQPSPTRRFSVESALAGLLLVLAALVCLVSVVQLPGLWQSMLLAAQSGWQEALFASLRAFHHSGSLLPFVAGTLAVLFTLDLYLEHRRLQKLANV